MEDIRNNPGYAFIGVGTSSALDERSKELVRKQQQQQEEEERKTK